MNIERTGAVESAGGIPVWFTRSGAGPPLVLVHGTAGNHLSFRFLQPLLEQQFTVYAIDRRGRGESGDSPEYAIDQEFEDIAAVVDSIGGPVHLFGHSYGATCALGAAPLARNLRSLILYEPSPGINVVAPADVDHLDDLVRQGNRDAAVTAFFRDVLAMSDAEVEEFRAAPSWRLRVDAAHTIPRELRAEAAYAPDPARFRRVTAPAMLLLGGESPAWARQGTEVARSALPNARVVLLPGEGHLAILSAPELVASEIVRFVEAT